MGKKENRLWSKAKQLLEKDYDYICSNPHSKRKKLQKGFINIGLGGIIPDVIGIKDIGSQYEPKVEIITIEVKENLPNYRERHMDQARRASAFAHKVFLAAPREFRPEEVELAVMKKVGLYELDTKKEKLKLIVPSPQFDPPEGKVIELMRRLEFFKCSICHCYWNKNLIETTGYRPTHVFSKNKRTKFVQFICCKCSGKFYSLIAKDLRDRFTEEWKFKRTNKAIERMGVRSQKFADKKDSSRNKRKIDKQDEKINSIKLHLRKSFNKKLERLSRKINKVRKSLRSI